ncbi:MAG TPA: PspC domain-containing protein, partial [Kribbellaceae bacterium]
MEQNPSGPGGINTDRMRDVQSWRRSRSDRMIAGVCGGIGRALNIDPVLIRVVVAVLAVAGGAGIPLYIAAWVLMPEEGSDTAPAEELLGRRARPDHPWLWPVVVGTCIFFALGVSSSLKVWPFSFPGPLIVVFCVWFVIHRKRRRRRERRAARRGSGWDGAA